MAIIKRQIRMQNNFYKHEHFYNFITFESNCVNSLETRKRFLTFKNQILFSMNKATKTIYLGGKWVKSFNKKE